MDKLTERELACVNDAGIKHVTYTDDGITKDTVTRLLCHDKGGHFVLRCNYTSFNSIEIVSIERSKSIRIDKGIVEDD